VIQFPFIRPDIPPIEAWAPILAEAYEVRRFSNFGPLSRRLEGVLAAAWGGPDSVCVAAASGTAALTAPLIAGGIRGRVVLPAFTFPATLSAIRMAGAEPFLVDVSPTDWRMPAELLARALDATSARAAIAVCPFGFRSDFLPHARLLGSRGGLLVIDNAAGLGATRHLLENSPHCFEACSLHVTKPFAVGEGGLVFAHRSQEDRLRRALNFGLAPAAAADLEGWGINGKLSELHAAVGLAAARGFAARLARRRALAARYAGALAGFPDLAAAADPAEATWQFFPVLLPDAAAADRFGAAALARGMETRRYYVPSLSSLADVDRLGPCPVAEDLATRICCAPIYADASESETAELTAIFASSLAAALGPRPASRVSVSP
jgi:dTDP-4-amino-4,6-dideoxygalactose transaminase